MAGWLDNVFWPRPLGATTPKQLRMHQRRVDQQRVRGDGAPIRRHRERPYGHLGYRHNCRVG